MDIALRHQPICLSKDRADHSHTQRQWHVIPVCLYAATPSGSDELLIYKMLWK
jgi:hypothetical protein